MIPQCLAHKSARNITSVLGTMALATGLFSASAAFASEEVIPPMVVEDPTVESPRDAGSIAASEEPVNEETRPSASPEPEVTAPTSTPLQSGSSEAVAASSAVGANLQVTPASVNPGERIRITGDAPQGNVNVSFDYLSWPSTGSTTESDLYVSSNITSDANGKVDTWLTIPPAMAPGEYTVHYSCISGDAIYCSGDTNLTVSGSIPGTRPVGVVKTFTADPLEGKAGDPVNLAGSCTYNGANADSIGTAWGFTGQGPTSFSQPLATLPLDPNGNMTGQISVPSNAVPRKSDDYFPNIIRSHCTMGEMTFGLSHLDYIVRSEETVTPTQQPTPPRARARNDRP